MSIALSQSTDIPEYSLPSISTVNTDLINGITSPRNQRHWYARTVKDSTEPNDSNSKKHFAIISFLVIALHGLVFLLYVNRDKSVPLPAAKNQVEIEFIRPEVQAPQKIEPPKPPPASPKLVSHTPPPAIHTQVAEQNIPANTPTIQENTTAKKTSEPAIAASEPTPPVETKAEQPVTEATGNAAYLHNPSPDYPAFAQRQGWEGTVLLRVHVLASGKPDKVDIKQSSNRKALDDAALNAVKNWTFVPSKRGNTAIDGWATVPIEFKLSK